MPYSNLLRLLEKNGIEYKTEYNLKNSSTFRIGGVCDVALFPKSADELGMCIALLDAENCPFCVVGRGSNTLFSDGEIHKAIVFTSALCDIDVRDERIIADAGVGLMSLSALACEKGLSGLEFACGIPGSVGGAMYMNAGAHGGTMADVVVKSRAYDRMSGSIITVENHDFAYRKSVYMQNPRIVCLSAVLELKKGSSDEIKAKMKQLLQARRQSQPLEYPSAGSYFKRPEGDFAGRLIEVCGLKGATVGGATVSEKHAGFIINSDNATFEDVMELEKRVIDTVLEKTGIKLEREVEIVR